MLHNNNVTQAFVSPPSLHAAYAPLLSFFVVGDDRPSDDAYVLFSAYPESVAMSVDVGRAFSRMSV
jgi:hypothetical protein